MAAPYGNQNAAKGRKVEEMLKRIAIQEDWVRLRLALEKLWDKAAEGDMWALQFIRDSLDGRPAQQIVATDADGRGLTVVLADLSAIRESADSPTLPLYPQTIPAEDTDSVQERH